MEVFKESEVRITLTDIERLVEPMLPMINTIVHTSNIHALNNVSADG